MDNKEKKTEYLCYNGPIGDGSKHSHLKLKLGVSGAAETGHCGVDALDKAKDLGREIVRQGGILVTGATTGFPFWSAIGAKEEKGVSIGISPASGEREHVDVFRLPLDYMDFIIYTGFGFPGRDLLFVQSCDAIFIGCGRIGTVHEFTIAFERGIPIGVAGNNPADMSAPVSPVAPKVVPRKPALPAIVARSPVAAAAPMPKVAVALATTVAIPRVLMYVPAT